MKLIPLLLCCLYGFAEADELPPLKISPELLRNRPVPAAPDRASARPTPPASAVTPVRPDAVETRAQPSAIEAPPPAAVPREDVEPAVPARAVSEGGEPAPPAGAPPSDGATTEQPAAAEQSSATPPDPEAARSSTGASAPAEPAPATARVPSRQRAGGTEVRARRILGLRSVEMVAEGDAELQRDDMTLFADRMTYNELTDEAYADGNVRIEQGDDWMTGDWARMIVFEQVGEMDAPTYSITAPGRPREDAPAEDVAGRGEADTLYFEGENQYRMINATWTTCKPEQPDWYIKAADLELDYDQEVGVARGGSLVFKDVPVLWWPRMSFPLAEQRQSGFLVPTLGVSDKTGIEVSTPYYFNLAPNYDATLAPRYMGRRGLQLAGEVRYLTPRYEGESRVEWLPNDRVTGESRALGAIEHRHRIAPGLSGSLNLNAVSDDEYFEDLSSVLAVASRRNLLREGRLNYSGGGWWRASALVQSYQTLTGSSPYRRLPQLLLTADRADLPGGAVFGFTSEYVSFSNPDDTANRPDGKRFHVYPQLSRPIVRAGYYITPKIGLHYTRYDLEDPVVGVENARNSITRTLPIFTVDSGLFFEREASFFGQAYEQTLEPRFYYVRVPYRDQDDIPRFDTAQYDFGFAQIFSENRYSGIDRIGDANQLTVAVTSRLIEPESGAERIRATVGQRFHFSDRRVQLSPGQDAESFGRTDVLAALSGRVTRAVSVDTALQYNLQDSETQRFNAALRYQPDPGKAFNVGYRYARNLIRGLDLRDLDVSAQWPLGRGWYGVGRVTRSIEENRITEALAGFEYASPCGCWTVRAAMHRFAVTEEDVTSALFFQLELSGLGGIGPSPVNLLKRSVPGYGMINESIDDRYFGQ